MWKWLFLAFIIVPAVEIAGFSWVSEQIGGSNTFIITLLTSVIGLVMMRFEGRKVLEDSKAMMNNRQIPGKALVDGISIFIGGILLVLPGFVTDLVGFTMVFPLTRPLYRLLLIKWIGKKIKDGNFRIYKR